MAIDTLAPNSIETDMEAIVDPKMVRSWYLDSGRGSSLHIDNTSVWEEYRGEGVKVAVIDSVIDYTHADLSGTYDAANDYDLANGDDGVEQFSYGDNAHGTWVAGVIAADDDGAGMVGVAPDAEIASLAVAYDDTASQQVIDGLYKSVEFDVVNCSWSFVKPFADNFAVDADYAAALAAPVETGRDGLGTVVVFSAGNTGIDISSNYHSFQNSPYSIAVGAIKQDGSAASFTSIGYNVLVSAAGVDVFTTNGGGGYSSVNGTSFSAPIVSGVVALMLEANPELGYRDVQQILAMSARVEGLDMDDQRGTGWIENGATTYNGGGLLYSDAFGYGNVNAHDAVRLAETWTEQQTAEDRSAETVTMKFRDVELRAGVTDELRYTFSIEKDVEVEHVQLKVDLSYKHVHDLTISVTSPSGTKSILTYDTDNSLGAKLLDFPLTTVASMGEMSAGEWVVEIVNHNPDAKRSDGSPEAGALRDLELTVFGSDEDTQNDTYVFTDEYGGLRDAERAGIEDLDGGTDAINAAAVTSDSRIDLRAGQASTIDGALLKVAKGRIENAFAGDGNDTLIGNEFDNWLRGGRGDDVFAISDGDDVIWGEAGSDKAIFEVAADAVSGFVTTLGEAVISFSNSTTQLIGVEYYQFTDVTMTFDELGDWLAGLSQPATETPETEAPATETPATETPPVETPPADESDTGAEAGDAETGTSDGGENTDSGDTETGGSTGSTPSDGGKATQPPASNIIDGTSDGDSLRGSHDGDTMRGLSGNDSMSGRNGDDVLLGGEGNDRLFGDGGDDWLSGGAGRDLLKGGDGNDVLMIDAGRDIAVGEAGGDTFFFTADAIGDRALIKDFNSLEGDTIDVSAIVDAYADATFSLSASRYGSYLEATIEGDTRIIVELRSPELIGDGLDGLIAAGDFIL